ncbi:hypothetical protein [Aquimarina algiphila]|uniref:Uncharacterized protein n=1 Tax=Aquimarina algiphila TaxID=2047982 RepID=A0A554VRP8_9FLAO|nr:hypothetical protein [Aquimarina algiphila]TSE11298.1 hypothetical protein FOF46_01320 [Aquimarina algiphila]
MDNIKKDTKEPFPIRVHPDTQEALKKRGIYLGRNPHKRKYNHSVFHLNDHYNFLEYLLVVRIHLQKKYNISWRRLEFLLYLFPKQFFTYYDFVEFPAPYNMRRIKEMTQDGFVEKFENRKKKGQGMTIYCLTRRGKQIVTDFYQYLSGEKKLPLGKLYSPLMAEKPNIQRTLKMQKMIKKLATQDGLRFKIEED